MQPETRGKIIDGFMELLAALPWKAVTWEAIAGRSGVPLGDLRGVYDTRLDILADFTRRLDEGVLRGVDPDMAGESARERLFDILFSRLEALTPHKAAVLSLAKAVRRDPALALATNRIVALSMSWMLTAAGIPAIGPAGGFRSEALALLWLQVLRTWFHEADPALPRTMAELDQQLRRAERAATRLERFRKMVEAPHWRSERSRSPLRSGGDLAEGHPS